MRPLLISGPSGIGKSFLAQYLTNNFDYKRVVPVTTREPRVGEINGISYYFVATEEYQQIQDNGELFMSNDFFGSKYGFQTVAVTGIMDEGLVPVAEVFTSKLVQFLSAFPNADTIFLMPKDLDFVAERMFRRGDKAEKVEQRIAEVELEVSFFKENASHLYQRVLTVESDEQLPKIIETILELRKFNDSASELLLK